MRIIVTRPESDARILQARLEALGHDVIKEPLLAIDFATAEAVELAGAQAVIATSRNGLRGLERRNMVDEAKKLPLFAVGPGTVAAARTLGFELILSGRGTGQDLVPEILAHMDPHAGHIVHLAGDTLAFDLAGELAEHGFRIVQPVVYRMAPAKALSATTAFEITAGEADAVILLSPRTADVWVDLMRKQGLIEASRHLLHLCLSQAVARRLGPLGRIRTEIAAHPTLDELLALVV